ncbi:MAG: nicotinate-nucleotide adenylyltransferase [Acidobacteria bacterium]|nr:nicotinate-nucleotide adenylyltransferase [Acidobacteriota bacterium]
MKIALFGGTFDPIHGGHLAIARAAADAEGLDRVVFIPAGKPPHKADHAQAPYLDRLRMVELACEHDPRFEASRLEDPERLGGRRSYSYETIRAFRETLEAGDELFFLLGEDAFADLRIWYRLEDVVGLVEFLVVSRPEGGGERAPKLPGLRARWVRGVRHPASSTEIRRRAAAGEALDDLVPENVAAYITERGLYQDR